MNDVRVLLMMNRGRTNMQVQKAYDNIDLNWKACNTELEFIERAVYANKVENNGGRIYLQVEYKHGDRFLNGGK